MDLAPDSLLNNRYRIQRKLGQGGMGAVYLAMDTALDTQVAVKVNRNPSEHGSTQFLREARLLAALRHPNLPRVTDYFILEPAQYLVMDYIAGQDLEAILNEHGPRPLEQVLDWANQIGNGLSYLHHQEPPVVHRDVKPANVRLSQEGQAILVDFGIAKALDPGQSTTGTSSYTPGYAPPEQYGGNLRTGPYTDQYALAALVYHLLSGQKPADSIQRVLGSAALTHIREINPAIPEHVQAALGYALALRPNQRFDEIDDFLRALAAPLSAAEAQEMARRQQESAALVPEAAPVPEAAIMPEAAGMPAATLPAATLPAASSKLAGRKPLPMVGLVIGGLVVLALVVGGILLATGRVPLGAARVEPAAITATLPPAPSATPSLAQAEPVSGAATSPAPSHTATATQLPPSDTPQPTTTRTTQPSDTPTPLPSHTPTPLALGGGGQIAFVSDRADGKTLQIWTLRATLNDQGQLMAYDLRQRTFSEGSKRQPAWSPDGRQLVYVAPGTAQTANDLWIMDIDGDSQPRALTSLRGNESEPAWSPDGQWIAFSNDGREDKNLQIYLVRADGSDLHRLSFDQAESGPSWSPDNRLSFIMNAAGARIVFIRGKTDPKTGATPERAYYVTPVRFDMLAERFTDNLGQAGRVVWSPDGQWIAYTRLDGSRTNVYVARSPIKVPAQDVVRLTTTGNDSAPCWSPDGQWLAFTSSRDGNTEIYLMRATGQLQSNLSLSPGQDLDPAWMPLEP